MSKGLFTLAGVLLASAMVSVAQTQNVEEPVQRVIATFPVELTSGGPLAKVLPEGGMTAAAKVVAMGPAPPLTRVLVYAVGSTQYGGWEYMTTIGQQSTVGDHGGDQFRVVVQEIGYGNVPTAWIGGYQLPPFHNYQNDPICISGNYYVSPCPVGGIIVGYYRYYNLDGFQIGGWFDYQNSSTNGGNTLSTSIYIQ